MAQVPPRNSQDAIAREVDRLLKKLPGADPLLRGDPGPREPAPPAARVPGAVPGGTQRPASSTVSSASPLAQQIGVWLRALLGLGLSIAVTQWPYARHCGVPLYLYLVAITVVLVAGAWAASWSWRLRMAVAHVVSLTVVVFGLGLAAGQILPRAGYAAVPASWSCS